MGRVFVRYEGGPYYVEFHVGGKTFRKKAFKDRKRSEELLRKLHDDAVARLNGLPVVGGRIKPLHELAIEYLEVLEARGRSAVYRSDLRAHLDAAIPGCGWSVLGDVNQSDLERWIHRVVVTKHKRTNATANNYARSVHGFVKWAAKLARVSDPLAGLKKLNESVTAVRSRRILTDEELRKLIAYTETAKNRSSAILKGPDRAMLYRVAALTGLRAGDLAQLRPESFRLEQSPPVVISLAKDSKGKREEPIPLASQLVESLKPWLAKKPRGKPVWPGKWAINKKQGKWLAQDVAATVERL